MALDFDPTVVGLSSQPFALSWHADGEMRSHTPDYFVRLRDGTAAVVAVRADDKIEPADEEAFAATATACDSVGWQFRRVGALDAVQAANLRWLAGYRHPRCLHSDRAQELQRVFRDPLPLLEGARRVGDPLAVLPTLYHLVAPGSSRRSRLRRPGSIVDGAVSPMTVSRPHALRAGDHIRLGGELYAVDAVSSSRIRLVNVLGTVSEAPLAEVLANPGFAMLSPRRGAAPPPSGLLDGVPEAVAEHARWWEHHIVEILTGLPPEHEPGATPKPEYDSDRVSLRQRELAKLAELTTAGVQVSFPTLKRLRRAYERDGLWGVG